MSLRVYNDLVQGSEEWLAARRGIVTASVVGQLITPRTIKPASNDYSRALTMLLVAERITGWSDPVYVTADMERGNLDEPIARAAYAQWAKVDVDEVGFMVLEEDDYKLGYSPDGLVRDDGLIEIKSRRAKSQVATILADEVPLANLAQMHAGMVVSGRAWCDYVSFSGGLPLYVKRVHFDEQWANVIMQVAAEFEATAKRMVESFDQRTKDMPKTERIDYDLQGMVI